MINATINSRFRNEVVRAMWQEHDAQAMWQTVGKLSAATFLFAALCKHTRVLGTVFLRASPGGTYESSVQMREMWQPSPKTACASQGWEFSKQCARELRDIVPALSQVGTSENTA